MPQTIEAIEILPRDPGFCRLSVGGAWVGPVRRDEIDRLKLAVGVRWTRAISTRVALLVDVATARRAALGMLARSTVSRERLQARLADRGHDENAIVEALAQLTADGWLDDGRAADERAASVVRRRPMARAALEGVLEEEGFRRQARTAAKRALGDGDDFKNALAEATRPTTRRRGPVAIARALSRRGFDSDTIERVMARLGLSLEQDDGTPDD